MEIRHIMTHPVQTVENTATVEEAAKEMAEHGIGVLAVRVAGHLVGIITDRDLVVRCIANGKAPSQTSVGSIMSTHPTTLAMDDSIEHAARLMATHHVHRLPVLENRRLVGIVSATDIARHYRDEGLVSDLAQELATPARPPST